ncbi:28S ribosomal protein S29, mitochondrial [Halotydeus destructor]|nr:28S ribosomal protein S29, mitochondrial [Halotydeus destructor]
MSGLGCRTVRHFRHFPGLRKNVAHNNTSQNQAVRLSTAAEVKHPKINPAAYTQETDPAKHNAGHEGLFYIVPPEVRDRVMALEGLRDEQEEMFKFLDEAALIVRKPALEIIDKLERTDFSLPVNRYVLHGPFGSGKSMTLNHVLHYGLVKEFLLVHISQASSRWFNKPQDMSPSESRTGRLDLPTDSAMWLQQFKTRNAAILPRLNLTTSQKYTWSLREITEAGEPLTNVVEHGINRMKHASDCVAVVLKELKKSSKEGSCRLLVTCDIVNTFYSKTAEVRHPNQMEAAVDHFTIGRAFKKLFLNDWNNGAVIAGVDSKPYYSVLHKALWPNIPSDLPKHLLTEEGFNDFDPFIPIRVAKYSEKEIENCLDYYTEKLLLQRDESRTPAGRQEMKFLSSANPLDLYKLATSF